MRLFNKRSRLYHKDNLVRLKACEKLNPDKNQSLLAEIAKNDKDFFVRLKACEKLHRDKNQSLLADIAKNDNSEWVRLCAIKKLIPKENQDLLADIAMEDESFEIKKYVIKKLNKKRWGKLISKISKKLSDKICPICEVKLIKKKTDIPMIVQLVKEGLTSDIKHADDAKRQAQDAIKRFAYKCKTCGTVHCKKCAEKKACSKCGNKTFDYAVI